MGWQAPKDYEMGSGADMVHAGNGVAMAQVKVPDGFAFDIINQKLHPIPGHYCHSIKPRVRWIWSKYFGCWQWSTANASGLLPGIRTADEERDFHTRRGMFGGWMQ